MIARLLRQVGALLTALGWPTCPDCGGIADLFEGRCQSCFRERLACAPAFDAVLELAIDAGVRLPRAQGAE